MKAGSLRLRLFLAGAVSIGVALGLSALGLRALFERHTERGLVAEMSFVVDTLAAGLGRGADGSLTMTAPPLDPRFDRPLSGSYWQIGSAAEPSMLRSRSLWDAELALPRDNLSDGAIHTHRISGPDSADLLVTERLITLPSRLGGNRVRVAVGRGSAEIALATRAFTADLAPYLAVIGLLLLAAAATQVAVGLAPLKDIQGRVAAVRSGRAARVGNAFPNEIRPLAVEMDALLDQRQRDVAAAFARAADLAHGLKTPLQVLSGEVERLRRQGAHEAADLLDDVGGAMRRHVERELSRARRASRGGDAVASVGEVVTQLVRVLGKTPRGRALEWVVDIPPNVVATIHPDDLAEAIGAIAENAGRFAVSTVRFAGVASAGKVRISVVDDGPGIPDDRRADVLRRGGRLDVAGPGAGLGLAIASDIALAHQGAVEMGPTTAGAMTVTLVLPSAADGTPATADGPAPAPG